MWRAFLRKGRADLVSRPLQSVLLVVVVAAGVTSLTLSVLVRESTGRSFEEFLQEAHGGDAWIFSSEQRLQYIARDSEVVEAGEPMPAVDSGRLISTTTPYVLSFFGLGDAISTVAPGVITSGRWLEPGADDEAVLDRGLAADAGLEVGDSIEVAAKGGTSELTIVGLVVPTSRAPYPVWEYARVFVTEKRLVELGGGSADYYAAGYVLRDRDAAPEFVASVLQRYRNQAGGRAWQEIRDSVVEENDATFILLGVFATFALGASIFIIASAITGQVQTQLRDVGLLKAVGFTPFQVMGLLVGETLLLGAFATGLGILAGWVSAPLFLDKVQGWIGSTEPAAPGQMQIVLTILGTAVLVALATALPAWRAGRTSTIGAIRGAQGGTGRGTSRLVRLVRRLRLPESFAMAAKDVFSRPTRAWLTIAAVAVASAAIVATLTIEGTLDRIAGDSTRVGGEPFELELEPVLAPGRAGGEDVPRITHDDIVSLIEAEAGVETFLTRRWVWIQVGDQGFAAYAVGGHYEKIGYPLVRGRVMSGGDGSRFEAMIALGLASRLGLEVGDTAEFSFAEVARKTQTLEVVGIYVDNDNDGLVASLDLSDVRRLAPDLDEGAFGLKIAGGADPDEVASRLIRDSGGRVVVGATNDDVQHDIERIQDIVRPVMAALSALLLALVSLNLLSTLQLSVRERTREIGLLKAIGFTPQQVVASIVSGAIVLAAIGAVIGVPAGWLFVRFVFEQSASESGWDAGAVIQKPQLLWFPALAVTAVLVAALGSAIPARVGARMSVSDALRYE